MLADVLRQLYAYNDWATGRVLDAAEHLTSEQLHTPGQAGTGSVRDVLLHYLSTHRGWLSWWDGSLSAMEAYNLQASPDEFEDVAALRRLYAEVRQQSQAFVSRLRDDDPGRVYGFDLPNGQRWEMALWGMMTHIVNHSTQHRAEAAAMLTGVGHSPGDLDLMYYLARPLDAPADEDPAGRQWDTVLS